MARLFFPNGLSNNHLKLIGSDLYAFFLIHLNMFALIVTSNSVRRLTRIFTLSITTLSYSHGPFD